MQISGLTHIIILLNVISEGSRVGTLHVGMGLYCSSPTVLREKLHWRKKTKLRTGNDLVTSRTTKTGDQK